LLARKARLAFHHEPLQFLHQNTATPATSAHPSAISVMPLMTRSTGRNSGQSKSNSSDASRSALIGV
jgi:hypothetical protein